MLAMKAGRMAGLLGAMIRDGCGNIVFILADCHVQYCR